MEIEKAKAHRIAVLSDTHGILRPEVIDIVKTCEIIMHGGDVGKPEIIEQLNAVCKTYVVRGNVDKDWAENLEKELTIELFGFRMYMVHNKKQIRKDLTDVDFIIYGHSHRYEVKKEKNFTYLNPGSCGPKRFYQPVTMMVLTLYPVTHRFETERMDCFPVVSQKDGMEKFLEKDRNQLIREIMKAVDAGKSVEDIAKKNGIDQELAEQICRIYVTHQGIDVDGIMTRMEIKNL